MSKSDENTKGITTKNGAQRWKFKNGRNFDEKVDFLVWHFSQPL